MFEIVLYSIIILGGLYGIAVSFARVLIATNSKPEAGNALFAWGERDISDCRSCDLFVFI